jgi:hypothetical protein
VSPKVAIINRSSVMNDTQARGLVQALQTQVTRDFTPVWGNGAQLDYVPKGQQPDPGWWWLMLLDDSDQAGSLGYHDLTSEDLPLGKVFLKTVAQYDSSPSITASHELLEMLGDPYLQLAAAVSSADGNSIKVYALENCDPVEDDSFGYKIGGVLVSDFVTPAWFDTSAPKGTRFDFQGKVSRPLEILKGGYIGVLSTSHGWTQETAGKAHHHSSMARFAGNRWHRRRAGRHTFRRSTGHREFHPESPRPSASG